MLFFYECQFLRDAFSDINFICFLFAHRGYNKSCSSLQGQCILQHISLYADFVLLVLISPVTITVVYFIVRCGTDTQNHLEIDLFPPRNNLMYHANEI